MHVFLHFKSFCLVVLQLILASKLSEWEQFENFAANYQFRKKKRAKMTQKSDWCHCQAIKRCLWVGRWSPDSKIEFEVGSVFFSFALGCSHLPKNSILSAKRQFSARFSNCSNSLNFEAKINCNTIKPNVPKWRKTCTGLKFDLLNFYGPQSNIHTFEIPVFFGPPCRYLVDIIHSMNL